MSHLSRFRDALEEKGLDAAILSCPIAQRYVCDFAFSDGLVLVVRDAAYVITDFRYVEAARASVSSDFTVLTPSGGQLLCVGGLLADHGATRAAIEERALSVADYKRYGELLPDVKLETGASELLSALRACKDEAELACIERAQRITDAAFSHILDVLRPDMTEVEVALELEFFMRRQGADGIAFDTIAVSGSNSSRPHGVPRPVPLERGFLTMDFGASVDGYCADMTRTVVLGSADAEMKRLYDTVLTAQRESLAAAHEGMICRELDRIARDRIDGAGYKGCFGHSLGHGVGMEVHEAPRLSSAASPDSRLLRGHVVTFEPGIYLEGKYGCRIEDMACIRPDGSFYNFTKSPKELIELF